MSSEYSLEQRKQLADASPLKPSIVDNGIDFIVVRELIGGVYFGSHTTEEKNGEKDTPQTNKVTRRGS